MFHNIFIRDPKLDVLECLEDGKLVAGMHLGMCTELHVVNYCVITVSPIMHARIIVKQ